MVMMQLNSLRQGHNVTVFERNKYDENKYEPEDNEKVQAASVDLNKIVSSKQVERFKAPQSLTT